MTRRPFDGFRPIPRLPWEEQLALSVLIHIVALAVIVLIKSGPPGPSFIVLDPPEQAEEVVLPPLTGTRMGTGRGGGVRAPPPAAGVPQAPAPAVPVDSAASQADLEIGRFRLLTPRFGDGRLWVRPQVDLTSGNVTVMNIPVDSAVRVRIQQMVDSFNVARARQPRGGLPNWTTEIAGAKFGLDSQFVYIAGIKIPAVLLALLPLPQGNIEQAERAAMLNSQRQEIQFDMMRQSAREDQERYAEEMRRRRQEERDAERRRRERPPAEPTRP
jgi:hypothetical protein